jgi:hypothetical protein
MVFAQIMWFLELLKFSKIIFKDTFEKRNQESFIFQNEIFKS